MHVMWLAGFHLGGAFVGAERQTCSPATLRRRDSRDEYWAAPSRQSKDRARFVAWADHPTNQHRKRVMGQAPAPSAPRRQPARAAHADIFRVSCHPPHC
jgi:hypothetical protein